MKKVFRSFKEEKVSLRNELNKADSMWLLMNLHNDLYSVVLSLTNDSLYTKKDAAIGIVEILQEIQREIGEICNIDADKLATSAELG